MPVNHDNTKNDDSQRIALLELIPNAALAYDGARDLFYFNALAAQWLGVEHSADPVERSALILQVSKLDDPLPLDIENTPWRRAWNGHKVQGLEVILNLGEQDPRVVLCYSNGIASTYNATSIVVVTMIDISTTNSDYQALLSDRAQMRSISDGIFKPARPVSMNAGGKLEAIASKT